MCVNVMSVMELQGLLMWKVLTSKIIGGNGGIGRQVTFKGTVINFQLPLFFSDRKTRNPPLTLSPITSGNG